jgi:thioredoxin 1
VLEDGIVPFAIGCEQRASRDSAALATLFVVPPVGGPERNRMSAIINATDQTFDAEVLASTAPVLVDFSAVWCGPCKKLEPIVHEIAADYGERLKVVKVDVDHSPSTAAKFGVLSVPTLLLFRGGQVKDQYVGVLSKKALADRVDKVL